MSYNGNIAESYRVAGNYAARTLKGERPADLPVKQSTRIEMMINLKTVALGKGSPEPLLRGLMRFDRPLFYFLSQRENGAVLGRSKRLNRLGDCEEREIARF